MYQKIRYNTSLSGIQVCLFIFSRIAIAFATQSLFEWEIFCLQSYRIVTSTHRKKGSFRYEFLSEWLMQLIVIGFRMCGHTCAATKAPKQPTQTHNCSIFHLLLLLLSAYLKVCKFIIDNMFSSPMSDFSLPAILIELGSISMEYVPFGGDHRPWSMA